MRKTLRKIPKHKIIHVLPINDMHKHAEEGHSCLCNPKIKIENGHMIVIHNSWDGRELYERNEPIN